MISVSVSVSDHRLASETSMLQKRILTAVITLPLIIAGIIYLKPLYFSFILAALLLVGAWEWSALISLTHPLLRALYVIAVLGGIVIGAFLPVFYVLLVSSVMWVCAAIAVIYYQRCGASTLFQYAIVRALMGFIALVSAWIAMMMVRTQLNLGAHWLIVLLLFIFAADVGGYFSGRFLGKHALCSRVSPKKTWEGLWGGLLFSMIVAAIGGLFLSLSHHQYVYFILLAWITSLFSVAGDLTVSVLKRMSGVKDSGTFFPGHGGVLDRIDSVAAATVIFALGVLVL